MEIRTNRLRFLRCIVDRVSDDRCDARVELEGPDGTNYAGQGLGTGASAHLRASAQAVLNIIRDRFPEAGTFELLGVKAIGAFDTTVVIVAIAARDEAGIKRLVGSYLASDDEDTGAAIAVLNATNRYIGNILG